MWNTEDLSWFPKWGENLDKIQTVLKYHFRVGNQQRGLTCSTTKWTVWFVTKLKFGKEQKVQRKLRFEEYYNKEKWFSNNPVQSV